ncbi:PREDICTED: agamous-like MADS-box protein AGL62 [Ipomoea nil]|uniref:agamous-like MADS-box protein AGL62 n=1 Tax=Ipomoea nil TaxID=35883 RepID=UPI00090191B7|nr:PREDICTED: agamous-like MADS-box protein AGL62 [Ipomoea nil]
MAAAARTSKGRQRVEMVKMTNENNLQVTFSKRRAGLFKKASELSTLCGVEVAIVVFSPGKKVFSFGHPSVEAVVEKFLGGDNSNPVGNEAGGVASPTEQLIEAHRSARLRELSMELARLEAMMESEKKRGEAIDEAVAANREAQGWIRASPDELNLQQLQALKNGMENLMVETHRKAQQVMVAMHGNNGFPFNPYGAIIRGGSTSALGGVAAGALPLNGGVAAGAHPFTSGGAAGASSSSYNVFTARGDASTSEGANLGISRQFF